MTNEYSSKAEAIRFTYDAERTTALRLRDYNMQLKAEDRFNEAITDLITQAQIDAFEKVKQTIYISSNLIDHTLLQPFVDNEIATLQSTLKKEQ